jgi:hypothetical protein
MGREMQEALFLEGFPVTVDEAEVWRWLGSHQKTGDPKLANEVRQAQAIAEQLIEPKAVYIRNPVMNISANGVFLENGEKLNGAAGPELATQCAGADELVVTVTTIGPKVEALVQSLFADKRPLEAVIMDAVGSAASAAASRFISGVIFEMAANHGMKAGRILRPGAHYWDIIGQRVLFAMMPAEKIGVTLTPSCLILPRKSSSGVIPIGRALVQEHQPAESTCRRCPNLKCIARWEGTSPA